MSASTFLDYCLSCDRQIESNGEVYCSQQCRLADLCTPNSANGSTMPPTPFTQQPNSHNHSTSIGSTASSSSSNSSSPNSNPFVLPPAYDFSSHRNSTISMASSSQSSGSLSQSAQMSAPRRPASGYFAYAGNGNALLSSSEAAKRTLSPTSSRSSITSNGDHVQNELRLYESGFDQVRDWRRRRASIYENTWKN